MIHLKKTRLVPLLLGAMMLTLSACASGDKPNEPPDETQTPPTAEVTESAPADQSTPPQDSETPTPSETTSAPPSSEPPSPEQSESPTPTQRVPPTPVQSEQPSPTPAQSESPAPQAPVPVGQSVETDWFSDAVFLGDSRTDGLRLYSGIKGASFISHQGLSVFTAGTNKCINVDGVKVTAMEALARQQWAKVYLMLGINELGYSTSSFKKAYANIVDEIKTAQPSAVIYLQTLIPINEPIAYEHGTNTAINNEKLKEFNQVIREVAQEKGALLVDVDSYFWSDEGCLAPENTGDGVHLTRAGYVAWFEYLKTHTSGATTVEFWPSTGTWIPAETPMPTETWLPTESWPVSGTMVLPNGSYAVVPAG